MLASFLLIEESSQASIGRIFRVKQKNLHLDKYKDLMPNSELDSRNDGKFHFLVLLNHNIKT